MKVWIDENQEGFVSKSILGRYYFHLNDVYRDTYCGNVKYVTMTYSQFKKLYPVKTSSWYVREKNKKQI